MPEHRTLVFLDACVLLAASHSPTGGSALTLEVCRGHRFQAAVSEMVLLEARVNIAEKFGEPELVRFYQQLGELEPVVAVPPSLQSLKKCESLVGKKDAHILAAALDCGSKYLLSLDKRHLVAPLAHASNLPLKVMTPGDFLQQFR